MSTDFCSQQSYEMGVAPYGTASEAVVWLLLEYHGEWRSQALDDNDLSPAVQTWLSEAQRQIPNSRVLFIRSEKPQATLSFYIAQTTPHQSTLYHLSFTEYQHLLNYNPQHIIDGIGEIAPSSEKLFLVCTNGKRDQCCAKFGLPIYQAMQAEQGVRTWQCTHIGGHRFATTGIALPSGVTYGYITPAHVSTLAQSIRTDQLVLTLYRGRSAYPAWVNAAEYFLCKQTGMLSSMEWSWRTTEQVAKNRWRVDFSHVEGKGYRVSLGAIEGEPVPSSCFQAYKPQPRFQLEQIEALD